MKILQRLFFLYLITINWYCSTSLNLNDVQQTISPVIMEKYISYLASDELMGRDTPSPYLDSAAAYIAREFESFGLQPVNGSWFQTINVGYVSLGEKNHLKLIIAGKEKNFSIKNDFIPYQNTGNITVEGDLIFCGYGISVPESGYDDYKDTDVAGKIVLLLRHIPRENDSAAIFNATEFAKYSSIDYKTSTAVNRGAVGVIVVNDPLNHASMRPVGYPWPSLSKVIPKDILPLTLIKNVDVPVVNAGEEFVNYVFGNVENLKNIQKKIDEEITGYSMELPGMRVSLGTTIIIKEAPADNVIGFLEGTDPELKNEILVVGAHYDHVGYKKNTPAGEDSIYNGADDNASGTAGVMAIARAFSKLEQKPKRSVLFITFAGEERGLFGSRHYVDNPLFPLENTVAMLNLDMIGRNESNRLYVNAHSVSPQLKEINAEENEEVGMELLYNDSYSSGGSDHASFIDKGIAALFYHSGLHSDYHKPSDEADRIDFTKAARISQLAFRTAFRIANESTRYKVLSKN
jgi:aminopeptidase YwaD